MSQIVKVGLRLKAYFDDINNLLSEDDRIQLINIEENSTFDDLDVLVCDEIDSLPESGSVVLLSDQFDIDVLDNTSIKAILNPIVLSYSTAKVNLLRLFGNISSVNITAEYKDQLTNASSYKISDHTTLGYYSDLAVWSFNDSDINSFQFRHFLTSAISFVDDIEEAYLPAQVDCGETEDLFICQIHCDYSNISTDAILKNDLIKNMYENTNLLDLYILKKSKKIVITGMFTKKESTERSILLNNVSHTLKADVVKNKLPELIDKRDKEQSTSKKPIEKSKLSWSLKFKRPGLIKRMAEYIENNFFSEIDEKSSIDHEEIKKSLEDHPNGSLVKDMSDDEVGAVCKFVTDEEFRKEILASVKEMDEEISPTDIAEELLEVNANDINEIISSGEDNVNSEVTEELWNLKRSDIMDKIKASNNGTEAKEILTTMLISELNVSEKGVENITGKISDSAETTRFDSLMKSSLFSNTEEVIEEEITEEEITEEEITEEKNIETSEDISEVSTHEKHPSQFENELKSKNKQIQVLMRYVENLKEKVKNLPKESPKSNISVDKQVELLEKKIADQKIESERIYAFKDEIVNEYEEEIENLLQKIASYEKDDTKEEHNQVNFIDFDTEKQEKELSSIAKQDSENRSVEDDNEPIILDKKEVCDQEEGFDKDFTVQDQSDEEDADNGPIIIDNSADVKGLENKLENSNNRVAVINGNMETMKAEYEKRMSQLQEKFKDTLTRTQDKITKLETEIKASKSLKGNNSGPMIQQAANAVNATPDNSTAEDKQKALQIKVKQLEQKLKFAEAQLNSGGSRGRGQDSSKANTAKYEHKIKQMEKLQEKIVSSNKKSQEDLLKKRQEVQQLKTENRTLQTKLAELEKKAA